jgi:hypothetical protein
MGSVADQSSPETVEETVSEDAFNKLAFMQRSAFDANGEWKAMVIGESDDFRSFAALGAPDREPPFFAPVKEASMKASSSWSFPRACNSLAKMRCSFASRATVGGGGGRSGTVGTYRGVLATACQSPKPTEFRWHRSRVLPWAPSTAGASLRSEDRFDQLPLGIAEFPSSSHALVTAPFLMRRK